MNPHQPSLSRRELLGAGAGLLAAPVLVAGPETAGAPPAPKPARALRLAHPTDTHIKPELRGVEGVTACLEHMMSGCGDGGGAPDLIITGGDLPMDTAAATETRSRLEWDLFKKALAGTLPSTLPTVHTMGNHDIWGRNKKSSGATGNEPHYGKRWFQDLFGYSRCYQSFDQAGWHFVILDSIHLAPDGQEFAGKLDAEQFEWLRADLAATPATRPVCISSHVPIMSVTNFFDKPDSEWATDGMELKVLSNRMHVDCRELDALFQKHRNVKLCLSGHIHLLDRCTYNGVTYICDGAVSGAKWKGSKRQTPEGYGVVDLYTDGTFEHRYQTFGWKAE